MVVGGGIIGFATAREVQKRYPDKKIAVLEKEATAAVHQSGHNSGVIHAGMYYQPGSAMAKCCVEGAELMYEYAEKHGIEVRRVGKFIAATSEKEDATVKMLYERGVANGVKDLRVLTGAQARALEPNVVCTSALDSPNTGVIDYAQVTRSLQKEFESNGGTVQYKYEVEKFVPFKGGVEIQGTEPRQHGPTKVLTTKNVITCCGLWMDKVGELGGGSTTPQVLSFRGTYYQMKPEYRNIVERNVYPVPSGGGIATGVHFTPTVNSERGAQMIVGPGATICFQKDGYQFFDVSLSHVFDVLRNRGFWNFALNNVNMSLKELYRDLNKEAFVAEARKLVPSVTSDMVEESFAGVMAQVFHADGNAASDYIFERKMLNGTTLHLRNAPSPAATSSLAIARHITNLAEEDFAWVKPDATSA